MPPYPRPPTPPGSPMPPHPPVQPGVPHPLRRGVIIPGSPTSVPPGQPQPPERREGGTPGGPERRG